MSKSFDSAPQGPSGIPPRQEVTGGAARTGKALPLHVVSGLACVTFLFLALILFTKPISWGDITIYAPQIIEMTKGIIPHSVAWEFGHLIWRPIGELVWKAGGSIWASHSHGSTVLELYSAMGSTSIFFAFVAVMAAFGIAWRVSRSVLVSTFVACSFATWNGFLNYFQAGTSYVPGLSMQLVGLYLLLDDRSERRPLWRSLLGGAALAASFCLWFPYAFGIPGVLLLAFLWNPVEPDWVGHVSRIRMRWIAQAAISCIITGSLIYGIGMVLANLHSLADIPAWISAAAHGFHPNRSYMRLATGLPRSLLEIGPSGLALKRFIFHDQYAHVGLRELIQAGLLKIPFFYAMFGVLIWLILRDKAGRPFIVALSVSWLLLIFFAVVLFEPSSAERFLPTFGATIPAVAFALRKDAPGKVGKTLLAALLSLIAINNFVMYRTKAEPGPENPAVARLIALKPASKPANFLTLVTLDDDISIFLARFPFHPLRADGVKFYLLTEPSVRTSATWRQSFAVKALDAWKHGGEVWISKRATADQPIPEWGWVEGDDPYLKWHDFPDFFRQLSTDSDLGGGDGFWRIAHTPSNENFLQQAAVMPPSETPSIGR